MTEQMVIVDDGLLLLLWGVITLLCLFIGGLFTD